MCVSSLSTGYSVDAFNAFGADEPRSQTLECVALDAAAADFAWTTHDCDEQAVYRKHGYLIMTGACVRALLYLPALLHGAFLYRHLGQHVRYNSFPTMRSLTGYEAHFRVNYNSTTNTIMNDCYCNGPWTRSFVSGAHDHCCTFCMSTC